MQVLVCPTYTAMQRHAIGLVPFTGLRQGELAALEWTDVHNLYPGQGPCACNRAASAERGPHMLITKSWDAPCTKTGHDRTVWLIEPAVRLLRSWQEHPDRIRSKYLWGALYKRGYDFGWAAKKDLTHGVCYLGARREAMIVRRVTFHHLRDTCASHLFSGTFGRKWSIAEVAKNLGHSATYVTERYAVMLDTSIEQAAAETSGFELPRRGAEALTAGDQTWHETWHAEKSEVAQVLEITLHAQRDSNSRHSVPKTRALSVISSTSEPATRHVQSLTAQAAELLDGYDAARDGLNSEQADALERDALSLARSVLDSEVVKLASRVADNDCLMLTHAIELARKLIEDAPQQETAASNNLRRLHNGQSGRRIGRF
jgi:hypothetical protein